MPIPYMKNQMDRHIIFEYGFHDLIDYTYILCTRYEFDESEDDIQVPNVR